MKIVMYSSDGCSQCDMAKKSLEMQGHEVEVKKMGVDFQPVFIATTYAARTVPQFEVDGAPIVGGIDGIMNHIRGQ